MTRVGENQYETYYDNEKYSMYGFRAVHQEVYNWYVCEAVDGQMLRLPLIFTPPLSQIEQCYLQISPFNFRG